ncbi:MAG TPA: agmatine deiminase family protein [Marinagarivorans sp.]
MSDSHMLPEWAPCKAVLLAWPYPGGDWDDNFTDVTECYWQLLAAISACAEVWVLVHPSQDLAAFKATLAQQQYANPVRVRGDITFDDTWVRDYGPISCSGGYLSFTFNGWGGKYCAEADNAVAMQLEDWLGQRPKGLKFVCEGGGLEVDAEGVLLANEECVIDTARNPGRDKDYVQEKLRNALGVTEFAWLNGIVLTGDDTDGHIDTIARFAPNNVVIYSGRNPAHHDASVLDSLHRQISHLANCWGWRALELPTPMLKSRVDGRHLPATYANFLICNGVVLQPVYGLDEDAVALDVVAQAFPDYRVLPVHCSALVEQHGSLHCATMQVAEL